MVQVSVVDPQFCGVSLRRSLLGRALPKIISIDGSIRGLFQPAVSDVQLVNQLAFKGRYL